MELLQQKITAAIAAAPCRYGIVIAGPSGRRLEINPALSFPAASMIKVGIMYEIMRQSSAGILSLDDLLTITNESRVGGAGILAELRPGLTMTVRELVTLMIIVSDNTATNLLIDLAGMSAINATMTNLGLPATVLRRRMMDFAAAEAGNENTTSAADLAALFALIQNNTGLPPRCGQLMLDILARQQIRDKLPFYLPEETVIAHKTGTLPGVEHDGGILYLTDGPYTVAVLTSGHAANYQGLQLIADIGKIIYMHCKLPAAGEE